MSSAINHKKRSRYSEQIKGGAFRAEASRTFYKTALDNRNRGVFSRMARIFHRKAPKQNAAPVMEGNENET